MTSHEPALDKYVKFEHPETDGDTGGDCTENDVRAEEDKERLEYSEDVRTCDC